MAIAARRAVSSDICWVAELYSANQRDALTAQERTDHGYVQGSLDTQALEQRLNSQTPSFVAETDDEPAGVLFTSTAEGNQPGPPRLAVETAKRAGITDMFLYGPVLVSRHARRSGLLRAMSEAAFNWADGKYAEALAFVEDENILSRQIHDHLGWRFVGSFTWRESSYSVLAYSVPDWNSRTSLTRQSNF
ncbi:Uncharacterised protein [Dermatophilus congolensis]|uniref:N-acetyltransferase domain-containing protein n=1 Tax=Dermatophilus congolensis TaxID=1863 RepID=A0AA46BMI6_9MICO|nr:hypothetical protein [Dermatophilus congolensis]STD07187.1 Uncharacterised protein [Dermatophilus congolensis]